MADRSGYVDAVRPGSTCVPGGYDVVLQALRLWPTSGRRPGTVLVGPGVASWGIVSDIDDTVMVTRCRGRCRGWNTFVLHERARGVVPGMADCTPSARRRPGAPVVYLSTGAWNVAPTLRRFLRRHGTRRAAAAHRLGADQQRLVPQRAGATSGPRSPRLVRELPHVRWLLVGDDGQHDPQLYAEFAAPRAPTTSPRSRSGA